MYTEDRPLKVMIIQAARNWSSEYLITRALAEAADPDAVDCHFVWQAATTDRATHTPARLTRPDRNHYLDFGRSYSMVPHPPRFARSAMMVRQMPSALVQLSRLIHHIRPDVLYGVQQWMDTLVAQTMSRVYRLPHIVYVTYPAQASLGKFALRVIRNSRRVLAASEFIRQTVLAIGAQSENVSVCYNTCPLDRFMELGDRAIHRTDLRREFGLPPEAGIVVAAGRLDPSKGHLLLIEAMHRLQDQTPHAYALFCGQTFMRDGYDDFLKAEIAKRGLQGRVMLAGLRRDMPHVYAGSDIFCLPTIDEAFGLVFIEAMTAYLPTVAVLSGGIPEVVANGETGLLSPPDDVDALAESLLRFLHNPAEAVTFGERGRIRALTHFAPDVVAPQWVAHLKRLATLPPQ